MPKEIFYGKEAFEKLRNGAKMLSDAVSVTMGAKGQNVLIEDTYGNDPHITKDGVTVAKAVQLKDSVEKLACNLIKKVALRTNDSVGDGTTTATVLAQAIVNKGLQNVAAGANPMIIRKGLEKGLKIVIEELDNMKKVI